MASARGMVSREFGPPQNLRLEELALSAPDSHEVVIDVAAAGVNFPDGLLVAGTYQTKPKLPFTPGSEVAGTVRTVGSAVTTVEVGQPVTAYCTRGGYAEQVLALASMTHVLPVGTDLVRAAVLPVAFGTAYHALVDLAHLKEGETLLVLGASGGVGLAAVAIGALLGARVVAAASTSEKLALCGEHGATELINYRDDDFGEQLREVNDGQGMDVVFDPVGGSAAEAAVRRLAWHGRYLTVGYASGEIPRVGMNRFLLKEASLQGVLWGAWAAREPAANHRNMEQLISWYEQGQLRPHIHSARPLVEAADVLAAVLAGEVLGKSVLLTGEESSI